MFQAGVAGGADFLVEERTQGPSLGAGANIRQVSVQHGWLWSYIYDFVLPHLGVAAVIALEL
jgi:hypothetical protein